jgi:hypothetical protein
MQSVFPGVVPGGEDGSGSDSDEQSDSDETSSDDDSHRTAPPSFLPKWTAKQLAENNSARIDWAEDYLQTARGLHALVTEMSDDDRKAGDDLLTQFERDFWSGTQTSGGSFGGTIRTLDCILNILNYEIGKLGVDSLGLPSLRAVPPQAVNALQTANAPRAANAPKATIAPQADAPTLSADDRRVVDVIQRQLELQDGGIFGPKAPQTQACGLKLKDGDGVTSGSDLVKLLEDSGLKVNQTAISKMLTTIREEIGVPSDASCTRKISGGSKRPRTNAVFNIWDNDARANFLQHLKRYPGTLLKGSRNRKRARELDAVSRCSKCKAHYQCICDAPLPDDVVPSTS